MSRPLRLKNQWFREERPHSPQELAGAAAFIGWRIAHQVLHNMRRADFEIDPGLPYFDFLAEWLVFVVQIADRMAYVRMSGEDRVAFTTALANRLGEHLSDNWQELLGTTVVETVLGSTLGVDTSPSTDVVDVKSRFIDRLNLRSQDYADFDYNEEVPLDMGMRRFLAECVVHVLGERDRIWVHDQVMEIESLDTAEMVRRGLRGLLGELPRRQRHAGAGE
ncbi:MAG: hypothetical protein AB3X41_02335 [Leptothrix ochracea]|uniref:hypothetical protein n=1 Tax=Leptothrix ochracea TaxID=735331 RepID=UPI0034E26346